VILSWNVGAERLLGWKEQEAIGRTCALVFTTEDIATGEPERELYSGRLVGRAEDERWHVRKDGSRFFASGVLTQVCDDTGKLLGFAKVMRDVTGRKEQEEQLRRSLAQKDTLVREIHHRVKNNLQVIVSLLGMQSRHTRDEQVLTAFREAESRLRAIAHIHEHLYASEDLAEVEFGQYVTFLARELIQLHASVPDQIQIDLHVTDLVLDVERAIPLGLIANELILNCLKHGLRGRAGTLSLRLSYVEPPDGNSGSERKWGELQIVDDGPGLPPDLNFTKATSMGLRLINLLVRQLRGRVNVAAGPGANVDVIFPLEADLE
jgi:PAS domain S-box-containing protein